MRRPVAILCSGQGAQHAGMFDLVADCPDAAPVFAAAAEQLGQDPRSFVREATAAELFADRAGQILCCTQALAVWAGLGPARPTRAVVAGLSLGELAAWGCAGAFDAPTTLRLARLRAEAMDAATPPESGLAAVMGLGRAALDPIAARHAVAVAIVHDIDSFVLGGRWDALDAGCDEAMAHGATRAVRLHVSVPSHTALLAGAEPTLRDALRQAAPRLPPAGVRLLSGIDGDAVLDAEAGCDKLARQVCTTIDWAACLESCRAAGAGLALELGPGTALSHMAARLVPDGRARSAEEFRTLAGLRAWLSRADD